jgi:hypothetical protein
VCQNLSCFVNASYQRRFRSIFPHTQTHTQKNTHTHSNMCPHLFSSPVSLNLFCLFKCCCASHTTGLYSPFSSASQILLRFFPYVFLLSSHVNKQCLSCQISLLSTLLSLFQCDSMQHIILCIIFSTVYTHQSFSNRISQVTSLPFTSLIP